MQFSRDLTEVDLFSQSSALTIGIEDCWQIDDAVQIAQRSRFMEHTGQQSARILLKMTDPISDIGPARLRLAIEFMHVRGNTFSEKKIHEFAFDV